MVVKVPATQNVIFFDKAFSVFIAELLNPQAQDTEPVSFEHFFGLLQSLSWPADGKKEFEEITQLPSGDAFKALIAGMSH